jgi:hypothetical protein
MSTIENDKSRIEEIIIDFFNNSDESDFFYSLLSLRGNVDATYQRFSSGMATDILNLVIQLNDESEIEKSMFKFSNAYSEFLSTIEGLGGLPAMMQSKSEEKVKVAISTLQVLAKIYCLKKILIEYFGNTTISKLDIELKKI